MQTRDVLSWTAIYILYRGPPSNDTSYGCTVEASLRICAETRQARVCWQLSLQGANDATQKKEKRQQSVGRSGAH